MHGRLLIDGAMGAAENMAVDEVLLRACNADPAGFPVLRFYWWTVPTLSIGAKERLVEAADLQACARLGIDVVRRPTGGRAVLHDKELTYSIIGPTGTPPFNESVEQSYRLIAIAMKKGLLATGAHLELEPGSRKVRPVTARETVNGGKSAELAARHLPCFAAPSRWELAYNGRKVVGSAQRRLKNAVLQHGSIVQQSQVDMLMAASGAAADQHAELESAMIGLDEVLGRAVTREELIQALVPSLAECLGTMLAESSLTGEEADAVRTMIPEVENRLNQK